MSSSASAGQTSSSVGQVPAGQDLTDLLTKYKNDGTLGNIFESQPMILAHALRSIDGSGVLFKFMNKHQFVVANWLEHNENFGVLAAFFDKHPKVLRNVLELEPAIVENHLNEQPNLLHKYLKSNPEALKGFLDANPEALKKYLRASNPRSENQPAKEASKVETEHKPLANDQSSANPTPQKAKRTTTRTNPPRQARSCQPQSQSIKTVPAASSTQSAAVTEPDSDDESTSTDTEVAKAHTPAATESDSENESTSTDADTAKARIPAATEPESDNASTFNDFEATTNAHTPAATESDYDNSSTFTEIEADGTQTTITAEYDSDGSSNSIRPPSLRNYSEEHYPESYDTYPKNFYQDQTDRANKFKDINTGGFGANDGEEEEELFPEITSLPGRQFGCPDIAVDQLAWNIVNTPEMDHEQKPDTEPDNESMNESDHESEKKPEVISENEDDADSSFEDGDNDDDDDDFTFALGPTRRRKPNKPVATRHTITATNARINRTSRANTVAPAVISEAVVPEAVAQEKETANPKKAPKTKGRRWTEEEEESVIKHMLAIRDEGIIVSEERFGEAAMRVEEELGVVRTGTSIKNWWSRVGRARSGYDERRKWNQTSSLATSLQGKKAATQAKAPLKVGRKRKVLQEEGEEGDDGDGEEGEDFSSECRAAAIGTRRQKRVKHSS